MLEEHAFIYILIRNSQSEIILKRLIENMVRTHIYEDCSKSSLQRLWCIVSSKFLFSKRNFGQCPHVSTIPAFSLAKDSQQQFFQEDILYFLVPNSLSLFWFCICLWSVMDIQISDRYIYLICNMSLHIFNVCYLLNHNWMFFSTSGEFDPCYRKCLQFIAISKVYSQPIRVRVFFF